MGFNLTFVFLLLVQLSPNVVTRVEFVDSFPLVFVPIVVIQLGNVVRTLGCDDDVRLAVPSFLLLDDDKLLQFVQNVLLSHYFVHAISYVFFLLTAVKGGDLSILR